MTALLDRPPDKTRAWVWEGVLLYAPRSLSNTAHAHFPATLLMAVDRPFCLTVDGERRRCEVALLAPNVERQTDSEGEPIVDLLVDPDDPSYGRLHGLLDGRRVVEFPATRIAAARQRFADLFAGRFAGCAEAQRFVSDLLTTLSPGPVPALPWDPRVMAATRYLRARVTSQAPAIAEVAASVGLSESRFSHLFRSQLGLPLRQYMLWLRIRHAMRLWAQGKTLAETATGAGFYDHAHFTRTLRRMTDYTPSMLSDPDSVQRCDCAGA